MHIPDNYLSPQTCFTLGGVMLPILKTSAAKVKNEISRKKMPLLGICSAFAFLVMMFNIPIPGGTTGHAIGGVLIAILMGPYAAVISVTVALVIQALFFGDGGILALGANIFNMAFVMPFTGYFIYRLIKGNSVNEKKENIAAFIGGYAGLNVAALFAAIEFGIQPILFKTAEGLPVYSPYPISVSLPAILIPHLLVAGILEGFVTAGVYAYLKKLSPELIYEVEEYSGKAFRLRPLYALLVLMAILVPLGLLAGGTVWGEWSPEELKNLIGYIPSGMQRGINFKTIIPDYEIKGIPAAAAYTISAVFGVGIILLMINIWNKTFKLARNR